jgi:hypothetical protein
MSGMWALCRLNGVQGASVWVQGASVWVLTTIHTALYLHVAYDGRCAGKVGELPLACHHVGTCVPGYQPGQNFSKRDEINW